MKKEKILNLFIGSNNRGKIKEIRDLLPKKVEILTPKDLILKSPKENGKSFDENSFIKAKFFSKKSHMIFSPMVEMQSRKKICPTGWLSDCSPKKGCACN